MSLSDKIEIYDDINDENVLRKKDVKEFIVEERKIIEKLVCCVRKTYPCFIWTRWDELDALAGDDLK